MKVVFRNVPARSRGFAPPAYSYVKLSVWEMLYFIVNRKALVALIARHPRMRLAERWTDAYKVYGAHFILTVK